VRTLYDAITPTNIPLYAQMVAGYVDGRYRWRAGDWARFPNAVQVRIAVFSSTTDGHVLDVEPGCSTPASAPGWVSSRRAAGVDPSVYCSLATWPAVRAAFAAARVPEPHYWIAAYPGNGAQLYAGSVAHQYANPGPVDISVVADYWPGVDGVPVSNVITTGGTVAPVPIQPVPTALTASQEDDMLTLLRWCYTALVGRAPSDVELLSWLTATAGWSPAQALGAFLAATAEPGSVVKAYTDFLYRPAEPPEVAGWVARGLTIGQLRDAIAASPEAASHR
jgi:hypothetical protein